MQNPFYSLIFLTSISGFYFYFSWRIRKAYIEAQSRGDAEAVPFKYFMWSFVWMGIFMIFHWLPLLAFYIGGPYSNYEWFKISHPWSHTTGHIFMHLSFAYAALVGAHFSWPKLKPYVFGWVFIVGILIGTPLTIRYPQVTTIVGPVMTGGDSELVSAVTGLGALGLLYAGIVLIYWAFKSSDRNFRRRSFFIGTGFILFFIAGPMNDAAGTLAEIIPAYSMIILSLAFQAYGILMNSKEPLAASRAGVPAVNG